MQGSKTIFTSFSLTRFCYTTSIHLNWASVFCLIAEKAADCNIFTSNECRILHVPLFISAMFSINIDVATYHFNFKNLFHFINIFRTFICFVTCMEAGKMPLNYVPSAPAQSMHLSSFPANDCINHEREDHIAWRVSETVITVYYGSH